MARAQGAFEYTAFVDACSLASALKRNLPLSLAEAEFFRLRWSSQVLDETEAAIREILNGKGAGDAAARAKRARGLMEAAFEDAMVADFDNFMPAAAHIPDPGDRHVVAAAVKTQAAMIVTENLKDSGCNSLPPQHGGKVCRYLSSQTPLPSMKPGLLQLSGACASASRNPR